ncbi:hypothetical protein [Magnetospirillum sulfuroxidans]|uniref:PepSY domain-containing protein n=1 Tax=Magnetospirillum sulfuroxidans TaxID=611300 RepID=A0ABS5I915_9PROT|nr:hypothetical protein [Magnetospirillum sulfuroxidans]MBR9970905.1 hypothetical protein [Magnetospirillum sulfuroxidans]
MKTKSRIVIAAIVALAAVGAVSQAQARGPRGDGPWDMMGGPGGHCSERAKPLTETQVKDIVEGMIAWRGDDATVGAIKTVDGGKITAEIVGSDGKVARTLAFDAKTGRPIRPAKPPAE